jgi:uncharacterized protein YbjT (DUF2867 family)
VRVLVLGATGYIGGRLVPELLERGHEVRCAVRSPAKLSSRPWRSRVEVLPGDVERPDTLEGAFDDIDAVYYLVHAMDGQGSFVDRDRVAAANVRTAADAAGVGRIIYLGGLGESDDHLSAHLASRHEVGQVLAAGAAAVTEVRAAVIIGSGSASFEMLRHLVEVLPVMVTPRWVRTRCQPIAVRDVLTVLCRVLERADTAGEIVELGGPQVMTYRDMMRTYAETAGLRSRLVIPVPVLSPKLSALWVGFVTPLPPGLARPLVASLVNEVVVNRPPPAGLMPEAPLPLDEAIRLALQRRVQRQVVTSWSGAGAPEAERADDPDWAGRVVYVDRREVDSDLSSEALFARVVRLGGDNGWPTARWLWEIRGLIDVLIGGVGLRRGRRDPEDLAIGDALDFWRVEDLDPPRRLVLRAEMRLPGPAWLEFEILEREGGSRLVQQARFAPRGLWGRLYWAVVSPFHRVIFPSMARRLAT